MLKYFDEFSGELLYEVKERTPEQVLNGLFKYMSPYKSPDTLAKYKYDGRQFISYADYSIRAHFTDENGYDCIVCICEYEDYRNELIK